MMIRNTCKKSNVNESERVKIEFLSKEATSFVSPAITVIFSFLLSLCLELKWWSSHPRNLKCQNDCIKDSGLFSDNFSTKHGTSVYICTTFKSCVSRYLT